jgi:crossover junction endodeoxyribonuclease RusA
MMPPLTFTVYGTAVPKGNHKAFHPRGMKFPIITESNRNVSSWQQLVAEGASHALQQRPASERGLYMFGVRLSIAFFLPRPKTLPRKVSAHVKAPDLDKLVRAVADAMTNVIFRDDSQVVELVAQKLYAPEGIAPHVDVRVESTLGAVVLPRNQPMLFEAAR